jgi:1,4-dihydroxy-6-naphthoate synthase
MIHEELLYYPQIGLQRVVDLGAEWCQRHGMPLPVGLNVIRRDLRVREMQRICLAIRQSLIHGLRHSRAALGRVCRFGRGEEGGCTERFVAMFANEDSVSMPSDVRMGLAALLGQMVEMGLSTRDPQLDIVEGSEAAFPFQPARVA